MMPSLVICSDEITTGGDSGDLMNRMTTTSAAAAQIAIASLAAILTLGCGLSGVAVVEKKERILSFESGAGFTPDATVGALPDSVARRRVCRSARMSAALA